jgi:hypothetical protein
MATLKDFCELDFLNNKENNLLDSQDIHKLEIDCALTLAFVKSLSNKQLSSKKKENLYDKNQFTDTSEDSLEEDDEEEEEDDDDNDDEVKKKKNRKKLVNKSNSFNNNQSLKRSRSFPPSTISNKKYIKKQRLRTTPEKWSKEEDLKLIKLVKKFSEGCFTDTWTRIAEQISNKTPSQCFQHWNRVLNPNINKEPWTIEEEAILIKLSYDSNGNKVKSWSNIASYLKGRTDIQCRYQFQKLERSKKIAWTKFEDDYLIELVLQTDKECPPINHNSSTPIDLSSINITVDNKDWVSISQKLYKTLIKNKKTQYKTPPRGSLECKTRWEMLKNNSSLSISEQNNVFIRMQQFANQSINLDIIKSKQEQNEKASSPSLSNPVPCPFQSLLSCNSPPIPSSPIESSSLLNQSTNTHNENMDSFIELKINGTTNILSKKFQNNCSNSNQVNDHNIEKTIQAPL